MITIPFKQFIKDCKDYYDIKQGEYFRIETELEMEETIFELYENEHFEVNYENNTIELY